MNPAYILALLHFKLEYMPEIAAIANKPTRASIKAFQEIIQDQDMSITTCDHNLVFLGMVLRASYFDPLNNGNPPSSIHPKIMKSADILALLPAKPEDMPEISTITNKITWASIKAFHSSLLQQCTCIRTFQRNTQNLARKTRYQ